MTQYVNQGSDPRIGGPLGAVLATLQAWLSYRSATPPRYVLFGGSRGAQLMLCWPPFLSLAIPRTAGRWASFRAGWRYDANWGDKTACGTCPPCVAGTPWFCERPTVNQRPWGGYIADAIVKTRMDHLVHFLVVIALGLSAAGCAARKPAPTVVRIVETVEVKVPVLVARTPPDELLAGLQSPLPIFVAPDSPDASSALTVEGERLLRGLIEDLLSRLDAWASWAMVPATEPRTIPQTPGAVSATSCPSVGREIAAVPRRSFGVLRAITGGGRTGC